MLVCLDVGNTHIVVGIYESETCKTYRISTNPHITVDELGIKIVEILKFNNSNVKDYEFIVSSVVPQIDSVIKDMCIKYFNTKAMFVEPGIKTGIKIKLDNPKELGADILVGAVAAVEEYGTNVLVIDMGTAITLVYINSYKELLGGTIFPGIRTSFSSLFQGTAKLEETGFDKPKDIIGSDTKSCIQSGMMYGYASLIEGMINRYHNKLGPFKTVITGGDAFKLKDLLSSVDDCYFDSDLLIKGLKIIYNKNK